VRIALELDAATACPAIDGDDDGEVSVAELVTAVRSALEGCGETNRALVLGSDFTDGAFATIELDEPRSVDPVNGQRLVHTDSTARVFGDAIFVINRFGGDNIQRLASGDLSTEYQCTTGAGSNPQDIVWLSENKAYVTVFEEASLLIVDPTPDRCASRDDFVIDSIDLSDFADDDGIPDMFQMALRDGLLYVALQRLDINTPFREPAGPGLIVVIDTATDQVIDDIELSGENPFGSTKGLTIRGSDLYITEVGHFGTNDGGIERVDLDSATAEGFIITEEAAGGDITDIAFAADDRAYAIVSRADFTTALIAFDPLTGTVLETIEAAAGFDYSDIEINDRGELFLTDRNFERPGVRVFDADDGTELTDQPLDIGLPPTELVFLP
jgi:hypothetical protein